MKSMTGYGRATATLGGMTLTVQVSSVNRKVLDISLSLPGDWDALEPEVREAIRSIAARGKVHLRAELSGRALTGEAGAAADDRAAAWDETAIAATLGQLRELAHAQSIPFTPTADLLWRIASAQEQSAPAISIEDPLTQDIIMATIDDALRAFAAMRAKEGEALLVDFLGRLEQMQRLVEAIARRAPEVPIAHREQLLRRLAESGLDLDPEEERVLKEIALFADRCDITEELTRLRSHLEQFTALLRSEGEIGRKAEFILQEIGREVNTIGAKANDLEIARQVIELKNELDRLREQIANVE
ncbi:hypothetical protein AXK11_05205 [Cephaloticoccus primus]|uniref:YicC family protein n=1 Tax=Cephaloticoccus primus TaxID=1548207 RepID=A0A139SN79_9BACT|nr:YicC/YloC family endoribonuclease [Cephaloticoccus primus]KXU35924.1 hypothetical protein AXK11_05205 [Cephaloticoccus primus]